MRHDLTKNLSIGLCLVIFGASHASALLVNSSFESGLNGFTVQGSNALTSSATIAPAVSAGLGNAFTTGNLNGVQPIQGAAFAVISTGEVTGRDGPLTTSQLSQTFTLGSTLSFHYNFMTDELNQPGAFNDAIKITLTPLFGPIISMNKTDLVTGGYTAHEGGFVGGTGWLTSLIDTSAYAGQPATLTFTVWDVRDSGFNSALAIDDIQILGAALPIPEPTTILFGAAVVAACIARRLKIGKH